MDIVREINGRKQVFCLPASQYIAGLMKKDIHEAYDIEVELTGTGAIIKKYSKRKHVDYHDKEHIYFLRTQKPPVNIGGWEGDKDLAVFYKTCTDEENEKIKTEGVLLIPYDAFKHLRDEDLVEITGRDFDREGKEVRVKFKAAKSFIKQYGRIKDVPDDMPWYEVSKDKFYKNFLQEPKKVRKWKSRRGKG